MRTHREPPHGAMLIRSGKACVHGGNDTSVTQALKLAKRCQWRRDMISTAAVAVRIDDREVWPRYEHGSGIGLSGRGEGLC